MVIYSWFSNLKLWFPIVIVSLPEGIHDNDLNISINGDLVVI